MSRPPNALTLARVFWRSLFVQAAWNQKGMQNLGFAYALYPALERLYPDPRKLAQASDRHLFCCFNTHPYLAAAIMGGALRLEERVALGEEPPSSVNAFKLALMGPLAALGDGFFWLSLRPACGALCALLVLLFLARGYQLSALLTGTVVYLLGYNVVHLALRIRFFVLAHRLGEEVVSVIAASRLPAYGQKLRVLAAVSAGAAGGLAAGEFQKGLGYGRWVVIGGGALFSLFYVLLAKGVSPYTLAYGAAMVALVAGLIF